MNGKDLGKQSIYGSNYDKNSLTKREYIASFVLQGIISNKSLKKFTKEELVKCSVEFTDLLLEELSKTE